MSSAEYEFIRYDLLAGGVAEVRLDSPERLNAINGETIREVINGVRRIEADAAVRARLLTGAPRADRRACFSAGVDVSASPRDSRRGSTRDDRVSAPASGSPSRSLGLD